VIGSYQITDLSSLNLNKPLDNEVKKMYIIDQIGKDFVVVNGERIEVDPPFETLPDKQKYETWLNEVMTDAVKTIGSRENLQAFQDHLASVAKGWKANRPSYRWRTSEIRYHRA
jgi:hypothetical protein